MTRVWERVELLLGDAHVVRALTLCSIGAAVFLPLLVRLMGWAGVAGALAVLVTLSLGSLWSQRLEIEWQGLFSITLIAFMGWSLLSLTWTPYPGAALQGLALQWAIAILGMVIAVSRETVQIVRALASVLRLAITASLVVEVVAGLLIDQPLLSLGVHGNLERLGPLQGLFGERDAFALVCLIGIITFGVEAAMRSVPVGLSVASLALSSVGLLLTRSPGLIGAGIVVAIAAVALVLIRRAPSDRRASLSLGLAVAAFIGAGAVWVVRTPIIEALSATGEVNYRQALWERIFLLIRFSGREIQGWGFVGPWHPDISPFDISPIANRVHRSASSAWIDALFQLGAVGLALLILLIGLALVRAWIMATRSRSVVAIWGALALPALAIASFARSDVLWGFGWLVLVLVAVKVSQQLSWRSAFRPPVPKEL